MPSILGVVGILWETDNFSLETGISGKIFQKTVKRDEARGTRLQTMGF
jgi:hypothetical protein